MDESEASATWPPKEPARSPTPTDSTISSQPLPADAQQPPGTVRRRRVNATPPRGEAPTGAHPGQQRMPVPAPAPMPQPALGLPRTSPVVERLYPIPRRRRGSQEGPETTEADMVQQPMPYGRVRSAVPQARHDYSELLDEQAAREAELAERERTWWFLPAGKDAYPLYAVMLVGLMTIPRVQDRDELVRVMIATAAYGVAVACSLFILQLTARSGFWTPDLETVPRVHRRGRPWFWGGRRPGPVTSEVEERDREESSHHEGSILARQEAEDLYSSEEDEDLVVEGEEERSRRISEALARAREKNRQVQMMEELKRALTEAQLQATTLQLKLNYYDSELMREKRERRQEKETLLSRQKVDVSRLFSLMIKYSPVTLREALAPSEEARCIVTPRLPFEIVHVNQAWSNTFQWDSHEIVGYNLNFFKGPIVDGTSWDQLLDALMVYGYATANIINSGSGGGHYVHVMTITPVVAPMPPLAEGAARPPAPTMTMSAAHSLASDDKPPGLDVDVRLLAYMVRSVVRKLPELSQELRERLDHYVTPEPSVNPTYLLGPVKARYPIQQCHTRPLMDTLDYMNQTDDALFLLDSKGHLLHTNALWTDLTMFSFREVEGKTLEEVLIGDEALHDQMKTIQAAQSKGGEEWSVRCVLSRRGGERFLSSILIVALGGQDRLLLGKVEQVGDAPQGGASPPQWRA